MSGITLPKREIRKSQFSFQSQSQKRLRFGGEASESSISHYSRNSLYLSREKNPTSPFHKSNSQSNNLLNKISDFYDKKQIKDAVGSVHTRRDRIRLIDSVVKRRMEIEEIEKQTKFEKLTPILMKAGENLKKRIRDKHQENRVRKSIIPDNLALLSHPESFLSVPTESGNTTRRDSTYEKISVLSEMTRDEPVEKTDSARPGLPPILLTAPDSAVSKPLFGNAPTLIKKPTLSVFVEQNIKKSKVLALLTKNFKKSDDSPRGLVFSGEETAKNHQTSTSEDRGTSAINTAKKSDKFHLKTGSVTKDAYGLGAKVLEKDLYRYLVKNEDRQEAKQLLADSEEIKEPLMRDIETKAKNQFRKFLAERKEVRYMLPNSNIVKANHNERTKFITGPCKCFSYQTFRELQKKQENSLSKKSINNSSAVKRTKTELSGDPYELNFNGKEPSNGANVDESFASFTETKLDQLYRNSYKINKALALINIKMEENLDKDEAKRWEGYKQKKMESYKINTREALRTIDRKMKQKMVV